MSLEPSLPLWGDIALFALATAAIAFAGRALAGYADRLADRTGLGEAVTGALLLGLTTALPGLTASIVAALQGYPVLALGNAIGGIAFQTTVLALADISYREANLEHAAASLENMMQTIMLILLLTLVLTGFTTPDVTVAHVHPMTIVLLLAAGLASWLVYRVREAPMWQPRDTRETVADVPAPGAHAESLPRLIIAIVAAAGITMVSGALVAQSAGEIVRETPIPEVVVGTLIMAAATSLPELVTCVASVRRGALTLAVGDIVGGNFFDVLFVAAADLVYLQGSIYHGPGVGRREIFITALTIALNVILLAGLINRQRHGPGNIGFESVLMLAVYVAGFLTLALAM
ncbi:MAG: sodium:calcium antiporter [Gammaproteobacteria bacterium]|nr:sodium:calcium antiporter [Gammaproteobacteria bacterium]